MAGAEGWERDSEAQIFWNPAPAQSSSRGEGCLLYPGTRAKLVLFLASVSSLGIRACLGQKLQGH